VADICPDFSGDGKGDNGLKALAAMINPELDTSISSGEMSLLFEFQNVGSFFNSSSLTLVFHEHAEPESAGGTNYLLDPESYNAICSPMVSCSKSSITNGHLESGVGDVGLSAHTLPLGEIDVEFPLDLTLVDAQVTGDVVSGGQTGVTLINGVAAGILSKDSVEEWLGKVEEACNVPNPETFCSYVSVAKQFLPMVFDLDLLPEGAPDGFKDAASICMQFTLSPSTIVGYLPVLKK